MIKEAVSLVSPDIAQHPSARIISIEEFDEKAFFSDADIFASGHAVGDGESQPFHSPLLAQLHKDAEESVPLLEKKLTRARLSSGLGMSFQLLGSLANIGGSCGVFCVHGLRAMTRSASPGLQLGWGGGGRRGEKHEADEQLGKRGGSRQSSASAPRFRSAMRPPTHASQRPQEHEGVMSASMSALFCFPLLDLMISSMLPAPVVNTSAA